MLLMLVQWELVEQLWTSLWRHWPNSFLNRFHVQAVHGHGQIKWGVLQKNAVEMRYLPCLGNAAVNPVGNCMGNWEGIQVIHRPATLRYFQRLTTPHVLSQNFHHLLSSPLFCLSHAAIEIRVVYKQFWESVPPFSFCHETQHKRTFLMSHQL